MWIQKIEVDSGAKPGITTDNFQRIKELERDNRELKRANEILRKAAAFFAVAELDRRPK
jgi:transposase-like protein